MHFSFFKKKKIKQEEAIEHINHISKNLKKSFNHIKVDIKLVRDWLSFFKTKDGEYENRFKEIESRIEEIGQVIAYLADKDQKTPQNQQKITKEMQYYSDEEEIPLQKINKSFLDGLTDTQRAMFLRLGVFQRESGQEWTSLKTLAQDIYPGKTYDKVRSTVSEYIGILVDAGLIEKTRKGKQTYITITEKGQQYFKKNDKKTLKKQVQKTK